MRGRVHEYLGGCLNGMKVVPEKIGGVADHVHVLAGFRATHCVADVVKELKTASTKWVRSEIGSRKFEWQVGYAAFSVSASNVEAVRRYIENQEEHHRSRSFQEEYVEFLEKHGVEFDPKFLW